MKSIKRRLNRMLILAHANLSAKKEGAVTYTTEILIIVGIAVAVGVVVLGVSGVGGTLGGLVNSKVANAVSKSTTGF